MEGRSLVTEAGCAGAQLAEVLGGLGHDVIVELEHDTAQRVAVGGDVKENVGHDACCTVESAGEGWEHRCSEEEVNEGLCCLPYWNVCSAHGHLFLKAVQTVAYMHYASVNGVK